MAFLILMMFLLMYQVPLPKLPSYLKTSRPPSQPSVTPLGVATPSLGTSALGGLTLFSGFFPKWLLIQEMISYKHYFFLFILLASTLITLYFYLRMLFPFMVLASPQMKEVMIPSPSLLTQTSTTFLNLFCLLVLSVFLLL